MTMSTMIMMNDYDNDEDDDNDYDDNDNDKGENNFRQMTKESAAAAADDASVTYGHPSYQRLAWEGS